MPCLCVFFAFAVTNETVQQLNTIDSSVTHLLVATKRLLESLTRWAKREASDSDVSDAYVQLGNEFKMACRAFTNAGVEVRYVTISILIS